MSGTVLLVEDNEMIQKNNKSVLERNGYTVRLAMTLAEARKEIADGLPDAMVLDITLSDGNGLDFLAELRRASQIPVLLLTAKNTPQDTTVGLDAGDDDYLTKPYNAGEFRARVDALMRRAARVPEVIVKGLLTLNPMASQAFMNGEDLLLTQKEFSILLLFTQNDGKLLSAEYLYEKVWGKSMNEDAGAVQYQISNLRKKIEGSGCRISVKRGGGYLLEAEN